MSLDTSDLRTIAAAKDAIDELAGFLEDYSSDLSEWHKLFSTDNPEEVLEQIEKLNNTILQLEKELEEQKEISKANLVSKINTDF